MRWIYLDAGRRDEFFLDLGAQALSDALSHLAIDHSLELFDGDHDGVDRRMPAAIASRADARITAVRLRLRASLLDPKDRL